MNATRAELIAHGVIFAEGAGVALTRTLSDVIEVPFLPIDAAGRRAADRAVARLTDDAAILRAQERTLWRANNVRGRAPRAA